MYCFNTIMKSKNCKSNHPKFGNICNVVVINCLGCYNKISQIGQLISHRHLLLTVWKLGSPRSRADRFDVLLVHRHLLFVTVPKRGRGQLAPSSQFMKISPSWPNHTPKVPPFNTITLRINFQHYSTLRFKWLKCLLENATFPELAYDQPWLSDEKVFLLDECIFI